MFHRGHHLHELVRLAVECGETSRARQLLAVLEPRALRHRNAALTARAILAEADRDIVCAARTFGQLLADGSRTASCSSTG